jgi:cellobiose PTS system EIIC component
LGRFHTGQVNKSSLHKIRKGNYTHMDGLTRFLEEKFLPIAATLSQNRYLMSIRDGLVLSLPLMIVGSMVIVIAELPVDAYQNLMVSVFGDNWKWWNWGVIFASTMGLVALIASLGVAYALAKSYDKTPMPAAIMSLSGFFILMHQMEGGGFSTRFFGAQGLFGAMMVAVITAEVYNFVINKKLVITLPEQVPPAISAQFTALVPAAFTTLLWVVVRFIFMQTTYIDFNSFVFNVLQVPLTAVGTGLPGTFVAIFFNSAFWFVGIHGAQIVGSVMNPIWSAATQANLVAYQAGTDLPYIVTAEFISNLIYLGGSGATLSLAFIMSFLAKSKQIQYIGRLSIAPGIFNINETVTFGLPIIMNPMMMLPFFFAPLVITAISYLAIASGLVGRLPGLVAPWTMPIILSGFYIGGGDVRVVLLQVVNFVVTGLIYFPFIMTWDKKKYAEEQGE